MAIYLTFFYYYKNKIKKKFLNKLRIIKDLT